MVLESLTNPFRAEKRPFEMFFLGFVYSSVALFLSNWIFKDQASLVMIFLTVVVCVPLIYFTLRMEERKSAELPNERAVLKEHERALKFMMFMFAGFVIAFVLWYCVLPASLVEVSFKYQTDTIQRINSQIVGAYSSLGAFSYIFINNLKVMIFCILFSFLFGAGAIFILAWNASVIATAIGNFIRTNLTALAGSAGFEKVHSYLQVISLGLAKYAIHGIPEIAAYFTAGIAGGIISVAVIRESFGTKRFSKVVLDSSDLILIAVLLLVVAGLLEVFITPLIF